MISDSSELHNVESQVEKLLKDNGIEDNSNSFNGKVSAFPYLAILVEMNSRLNQLEKKANTVQGDKKGRK